ncbi:MAG: hypothetical protein ACLSD6_03085 [Clostridium sp.]
MDSILLTRADYEEAEQTLFAILGNYDGIENVYIYLSKDRGENFCQKAGASMQRIAVGIVY